MAWLVFAVSLPVQQFILDENLVIHPNASETRFSYILLVHSPFCLAVTNDMAGTWSSVTLSGNLDTISPALRDFRWQLMNQARTRVR